MKAGKGLFCAFEMDGTYSTVENSDFVFAK